jgi:DNA-binding protein HU-beta
MLDSMCATLKAGREVRLVGFGAFTPVKKPAGVARNPRTGETVQRAAAVTCKFRPGDALKALLNS